MKPIVFVLLLTASANLYAETQVKLLLDWTPNTNHTGIYIAQEKGWYQQEGLSVRIIIPGESDIHTAVAGSAADLAIGYQEGMTLARAQGIPVVSIAAVIQHNTSAFAARQGTGIQTPADFAGKRYGSFGSPVERPMIDALMKCSDRSAQSVRFVDIGWADFLAITETNRIDFAWIYYGWTGIDAELKGVELETLMLAEYADCIPDYYTPLIMTSESTIAQNPQMLSSFLAATTKGYDFARSNPEEAAAILLRQNPDLNSDLVHASQRWLAQRYQADASRWGEQKGAVWKNYSEFLIDNGIIKSFDHKAAFSNDFLPE